MSIKNKNFVLLLVLSGFFTMAFSSEPLDAGKNASLHNNLGTNYLKEHNYVGAIKEYQIAIGLNPDTQVSATYYYNLGSVYMQLKRYKLAQENFEQAVKIYPLYFKYYQAIVESYKGLNILDSKLAQYKSDSKNPLNEIYVGLIYIAKGQTETGITTLDNFCAKEPNLLITQGVRNYIKELSKSKL